MKKKIAIAGLVVSFAFSGYANALGSKMVGAIIEKGGKAAEGVIDSANDKTVIKNSKLINQGKAGNVKVGDKAQLQLNSMNVGKGVKIKNSTVINQQKVKNVDVGKGAAAQIGTMNIQ